jgi:hypothetical protein
MAQSTGRHFLRIPGPTNVSDERIKPVFGTNRPVVTYPASGTLAGVQMGLDIAGVPVDKAGLNAALAVLSR